MRSRDIYSLFLIFILTGLALWVNLVPNNNFLGRDVSIRRGLDLQGGIQVLLRAAEEDISTEEMRTAAGVIERRVNALGVGETVVQLSGNDRVIVELPGVDNPDQAVETLRGTGRLEFIDPQGQFLPSGQTVRTSGNPNPVVPEAPALGTDTAPDEADVTDPAAEELPAAEEEEFTEPLTDTAAPETVATGPIYQSITEGKDLDTSAVQPVFSQGQTGAMSEPAVAFSFTGESGRSLAQFTAQNVGQPMCIVLDNVVVSCPVIDDALSDGSGVITTNSAADRDRIFNQLKFGALPVALQVETSRRISATLGQDSVEASVLAGAVGLTVVALFMLFFYRLPGLLAIVALMIYIALSFALYRLIPVTLTLAGIAGFILSIGLAVDANVLIFARLKEELRRRRDLRNAVDESFTEAWPAIRDSGVSTLITSVILYIFGNSFGVSIIKGFAFTLGLGITLSLFTAVVVTRTLMHLVLPLPFARNPWLLGLDPDMRPPSKTREYQPQAATSGTETHELT